MLYVYLIVCVTKIECIKLFLKFYCMMMKLVSKLLQKKTEKEKNQKYRNLTNLKQTLAESCQTKSGNEQFK